MLFRKITIYGETPSKKNQKQIFRNKYTGKPFIMSSQRHTDWHSKAITQLEGVDYLEDIKRVTLTFYTATRRKADLTNRADSVMDLLVDAQILKDDSWWVVPEILLVFGGLDKLKPRVEIEIYGKENWTNSKNKEMPNVRKRVYG